MTQAIGYQDKPWLKHYDEGVKQTLNERENDDFPEILVNPYGQDIGFYLVLGIGYGSGRRYVLINHQNHKRHKNTQEQYPPEFMDKSEGIQDNIK